MPDNTVISQGFSSQDSTTRVAKRIVHEMKQVAHEQIDMHFFMGLGFSLALVFEEMTGRTAGDKKPQELMEWALGLPDVPFRKVTG